MKYFVLLMIFVTSVSFGQMKVYETNCKNQNCFKYGWVTTSKNYVMDTKCKNQDCTRYGWTSLANDQSTYNVNCRTGGCFTDGWTSSQDIKGKIYYDDVFCKYSGCLKYGWVVRTGYDLFGGNVSCNNSDCSKYGGTSLWRGRPSKTSCHSNDCYKNGWTLYVY